jgi:hypothetical protein
MHGVTVLTSKVILQQGIILVTKCEFSFCPYSVSKLLAGHSNRIFSELRASSFRDALINASLS